MEGWEGTFEGWEIERRTEGESEKEIRRGGRYRRMDKKMERRR